MVHISTLRPRRNDRHVPDDIFKHIFLNQNIRFLIDILMNFVPYGPIDCQSRLVQLIAWRLADDKPLSEPMMAYFPDAYTCISRPLLLNNGGLSQKCWRGIDGKILLRASYNLNICFDITYLNISNTIQLPTCPSICLTIQSSHWLPLSFFLLSPPPPSLSFSRFPLCLILAHKMAHIPQSYTLWKITLSVIMWSLSLCCYCVGTRTKSCTNVRTIKILFEERKI